MGTTITKNNFSTTFNYIEENGPVGSTNILENITTFNLDNQNFITFKTRDNREIDLTEYYDLIYEYRNDCLIAGVKYNKTYYKDRDLEPTEDFMFSIKLIPLTAVEQNLQISKMFLINRLNILFIIILILFLSIENTKSLEIEILLKVNEEIITTIDIYEEIKFLKLFNSEISNLSETELFEVSKNSILEIKLKK